MAAFQRCADAIEDRPHRLELSRWTHRLELKPEVVAHHLVGHLTENGVTKRPVAQEAGEIAKRGPFDFEKCAHGRLHQAFDDDAPAITEFPLEAGGEDVRAEITVNRSRQAHWVYDDLTF